MNTPTTYSPRSNWEIVWGLFARHPYRPPGRIVICRIKWETGIRMQKGWHDNKLSLCLCKRWFQFEREYKGWLLTVFGIRVHIVRAYGGHFPRNKSRMNAEPIRGSERNENHE